ncbi:MAG: isocitrate lyase/phosphoenolpyruvate mutase family protein [Solirubrobacterales bacterium]
MTVTQQQKGEAFRALHEGETFVIPNPWDAGSARVLEALGFQALATTSSGFAFTLGRMDGAATLDEVVAHVRLLSATSDLPVSVDLGKRLRPGPAGRRASDQRGGAGRRGRRIDRGLRPGEGSTRASAPPSAWPRRSRPPARSTCPSR